MLKRTHCFFYFCAILISAIMFSWGAQANTNIISPIPAFLKTKITPPTTIIDHNYGVLTHQSSYRVEIDEQIFKDKNFVQSSTRSSATFNRVIEDIIKQGNIPVIASKEGIARITSDDGTYVQVTITHTDRTTTQYSPILKSSLSFDDRRSRSRGSFVDEAQILGYVPREDVFYFNSLDANGQPHNTTTQTPQGTVVFTSQAPNPNTFVPSFEVQAHTSSPQSLLTSDTNGNEASSVIANSADSYCSQETLTAIATQREGAIQQKASMRDILFSTPSDIVQTSCFDTYQLKLFNDIGGTLSNLGGFFSGSIGSIAGNLGLNDKIVGAITDYTQDALCKGANKLVDQATDSLNPSTQIDTMFAKQLNKSKWGDQIKKALPKQPSEYLDGQLNKRFNDPNKNYVEDLVAPYLP